METGLVDQGVGIGGERLSSFTQRPGESIWVRAAYSYRAERVNQVAVQLELENRGTQPWTVEGAELVGKKGTRPRRLEVLPVAPLLPGEIVRVMLVAEATKQEVQGPFVLKLGEAGGPRTVTLRGVTFP
jgi:uncharacterized protein (TIGR02268 family)